MKRLTGKKHKCAILCVILSVIIIVLCVFINLICSKPSKSDLYLSVCRRSIPTMFDTDLKGAGCRVIEKDSFGRLLLEYRAYDFVSGDERTAYVICQGVNSPYVFMYEDMNYCFDEAPQDIDELKKRNDWDMPINEGKCRKEKISVTLDGYLVLPSTIPSYEMVTMQFASELSISMDQISNVWLADWDNCGRALYVIEIASEENTFFTIVSSQDTIQLISLGKYNAYTENLIALKEDCHWGSHSKKSVKVIYEYNTGT